MKDAVEVQSRHCMIIVGLVLFFLSFIRRCALIRQLEEAHTGFSSRQGGMIYRERKEISVVVQLLQNASLDNGTHK